MNDADRFLLSVQADAERTLGAARTAGREQALIEVDEILTAAIDELVPFEEDEDVSPEQESALYWLATLREAVSRLRERSVGYAGGTPPGPATLSPPAVPATAAAPNRSAS